jgi:hypothetical protein
MPIEHFFLGLLQHFEGQHRGTGTEIERALHCKLTCWVGMGVTQFTAFLRSFQHFGPCAKNRRVISQLHARRNQFAGATPQKCRKNPQHEEPALHQTAAGNTA